MSIGASLQNLIDQCIAVGLAWVARGPYQVHGQFVGQEVGHHRPNATARGDVHNLLEQNFNVGYTAGGDPFDPQMAGGVVDQSPRPVFPLAK